ncbi:lactate dehydrogenase, partial [Pasteurellaceae bacterium Phil31]
MQVSYSELKQEFKRVLLARGVEEGTAEACATM